MKHAEQRSSGLFIAFLLLFCAAASAVATAINALPWLSGLAFFGYQVFCVFCPGFALLTLLGYRFDSTIKASAFSYIVGYCLNLPMYFLIVPFGLRQAAPVMMWTYGVICAGYVLYKRQKRAFAFSPEPRGMIGLFCVILVVLYGTKLAADGFVNLLPTRSDGWYNKDTLYWISNGVSLMRGFPPENVRGVENILYYHHFSSMQLAIESLTTGIGVAQLGLAYSYIQSSLILAFSLYALFSAVCRRPFQIALAVILVLCNEGYTAQTSNYYAAHMFTTPFGFDIGFALSAFLCLLVIEQNEAPKLSFKHLALFLFAAAASIGVKAPVMLMFLVYLAVYCIRWLCQKKIMQALLYGIGALCVCALVYLFIISDNAQYWVIASDSNGSLSGFGLNWWGTMYNAPILQGWKAYVDRGIPFAVVSVILSLHYLLFSNMALVPVSITRAVQMARKPRSSTVADWACAATAIAGFLLALLVNFIGYSQSYFMFSATLYYALLGIRVWDQEAFSLKGLFSLKNVVLGFMIALTVMNTIHDCRPYISDGIRSVTLRTYTPTNAFSENYADNHISRSEYEAYLWIRDNTAHDAVLLTNRTFAYTYTMVTCSFTERRMYIESTAMPGVAAPIADGRRALVSAWAENDQEAFDQILAYGVEYVIIIKQIPYGNACVKSLNPVFENDAVIIYHNESK